MSSYCERILSYLAYNNNYTDPILYQTVRLHIFLYNLYLKNQDSWKFCHSSAGYIFSYFMMPFDFLVYK